MSTKQLSSDKVAENLVGVEEDVMDIRGEVANMVVAVGTVMCRDVQGVVSLLMKPLMLYLKMISRIDHFVSYKLLLFFPF